MGTPPRSFAADAHDRIMVRVPTDPPDTRLWRDVPRPLASSASDKVIRGRCRALTGHAEHRGALLSAAHECFWLDTLSPHTRGARIDPPGFDGGKKIKGKKRHVLVDTQGLLMQAIVHAADMQDRDGGVLLMATLFGMYPFLLKLYADAGYQGPKFQRGLARVCREVNVEIVRRCDTRQVRGAAQALDRGTHDRLAQPLPTSEQGLGVPEPQCAGIPALGVSSADDAKAMQTRNDLGPTLNVGLGGFTVTYGGATVGGIIQGGRFNGQWNLSPQGASEFGGLARRLLIARTGPVVVGAYYFQYDSPGGSGPCGTFCSTAAPNAGFSPLVGQRRERGVAAGGTYAIAPGLALMLSYLWGDRTKTADGGARGRSQAQGMKSVSLLSETKRSRLSLVTT